MARSGPKSSYVNEWKRLWEPDLEAIAFNGATCDPTRVDPKVLQWVKQHCAQKPHFVKVIIQSAAPNRPGRSDSRLVVPSPFVQQHFRNLERVVKLENEDGKTWKVAFERPTRHPSWRQGWHRFAVDNRLKSGDVLVFVLAGISHFHFTHFREDGNTSIHDSGTAIAAVKKECNTNYSQSQEDSEDEHATTRASKQAPPSASPNSQRNEVNDPPHNELVIPASGIEHHSHVASLHSDQSDKKIEDPQPRKTRRLCKVGEKKCKERVALEFEEGGSTSMAGNAANGCMWD